MSVQTHFTFLVSGAGPKRVPWRFGTETIASACPRCPLKSIQRGRNQSIVFQRASPSDTNLCGQQGLARGVGRTFGRRGTRHSRAESPICRRDALRNRLGRPRLLSSEETYAALGISGAVRIEGFRDACRTDSRPSPRLSSRPRGRRDMFDRFGVRFACAAHLGELRAERRRRDHSARAWCLRRQSVFSGKGCLQRALHLQPVDRYSAEICRPRSLAQDHADFGQRHESGSQVCEGLQRSAHTRGGRRSASIARALTKHGAISDGISMIACHVAKLLTGLEIECGCPPPRERRPGSPASLLHEVSRSENLTRTPEANCPHAHCPG